MNKTDPKFFEKLKESRIVREDRKYKHKDTLFNDPLFKDKDFYKIYPTIYHLRETLKKTEEKPDIRLVYLACHHIIKYRGHFLFEGLSADEIPKFEVIFEELIENLNQEYSTEINSNQIGEKVKEVLSDKSLGINEKKKALFLLFESIEDQHSDLIKELCTLIAGGSANLKKMFGSEDENFQPIKLTFKNTDFEEATAQLDDPIILKILSEAKSVYDWTLLSDLIGEYGSISKAKTASYNQHKEDLKLLKQLLKEYPDKYNEVFKEEKKDLNNYASYSKMSRQVFEDNEKGSKFCTQGDFCKYLRNVLKDQFKEETFKSKYADLIERVQNDTFMPKQTVKDNSLFPNALHRNELKLILENAELFYPFLNERDDSGFSLKEKIMKLCTFRIPYYVGPLNRKSERAWLERTDEKITPWNFETVVNLNQSGINFMDQLIGNCTYLKSEKVIPKCSLLYQRYSLYNELNSLKVNGERLFVLSPALKKELVKDLFEDKFQSVTKRKIEDWLKMKCQYHEEDVLISGVDDKIKSSLKSEWQLKQIFGSEWFKKNQQTAEDIVRTITVFGGDKKQLNQSLKEKYSDRFDSDQIEKLSTLSFSDWGRLSEKLLTDIYADINGERMNILTALEKTDQNLMELLSEKYDFKKEIDVLNGPSTSDGRITYDLIQELYASPSVKRGIWRSLRIIEDILKVTGHPPAKVFIETTREHQASKRTISRKESLSRLYEACKEDQLIRSLKNTLKDTDEGELRGKDLYAY